MCLIFIPLYLHYCKLPIEVYIINCWLKQVPLKMDDKFESRYYICSYVSRILRQWIEIYRILFSRAVDNTRQPVYDIISTVRIQYCTETVNQIFKIYIETRLRCYIGIISRILADSYRVNKREYGLHVFIESLYNDIRESYSRNIQEIFVLYSTVSCPNTGEYGANKPVFTVVLCNFNKKAINHWTVSYL